MITTGVTLFLSFIFNFILIYYMTRIRKKKEKPLEKYTSEAEVIPLQAPPTPHEVGRQWSGAVLPYPSARVPTRELVHRART